MTYLIRQKVVCIAIIKQSKNEIPRMYILKSKAAAPDLFIFLQPAYSQQSPFNGMWVEIYPNSTAKKLQERCEKFDEYIYLGIFFVDGLYKEYLKTNKALWGKMEKSRDSKIQV